MKKQYNILILLLLTPVYLLANGIDIGKYSKQKTIKKAYIVNSDAGIDIKNSYGNVTVSTWDEDKIELDILIKVSGDSESWVDKRLDEIDVEIQALKSLVSAETKLSKSGNVSNSRNNSIEINYIIKIPKNGSTKINNNYGSIITSDLYGNANIKCQYGKIELAKLLGSSNVIQIDYCNKSTIESLKNATVNADYSGLTINDYSKIALNSDYTNINFLNGTELKYDSNYGKIALGKVGSLEGSGNYLTISANEVTNQIKIDTKYSKISVAEIDSKFKNVNIAASYTTVDINYNAASAFDFDISTKYANLHYDKELEMNSKNESGNSKSYQGYYRKSGESKMTIRTEYGNINLSKK